MVWLGLLILQTEGRRVRRATAHGEVILRSGWWKSSLLGLLLGLLQGLLRGLLALLQRSLALLQLLHLRLCSRLLAEHLNIPEKRLRVHVTRKYFRSGNAPIRIERNQPKLLVGYRIFVCPPQEAQTVRGNEVIY